MLESLRGIRSGIEDYVNSYVSMGSPSASSGSQTTTTSSAGRKGVPWSYAMSCVRDIAYVSAEEMVRKRQADRKSDCMMDILEWRFYDIPMDPQLFDPQNYLSSRGARGVQKDCYTFVESTRAPLSSETMTRPMDYIRGLLLQKPFGMGGDAAGSPRIHGEIRANDFSYSSKNSPSEGLLVGRYVPDQLGVVPDITDQVQKITGADSAFDSMSLEFQQNVRWDWPCITLKDVEPRLPKCEETNPEILLKERHCNEAYDKAEAIIIEFSKPIVQRFDVRTPSKW